MAFRSFAEYPLIDEEILLSRREIGNSFLLELIALYLKSAPPLIERIINAAEADDLKSLKQLCHKLKGMSVNVGAARLSEISRELEEGAWDKDKADIDSAVKNIEAIFEETATRLEDVKQEAKQK